MSFKYTIHRLPPDSPDVAFYAGRFSALRLNALTTSAGSFASTFALESALSPSDWTTRISRPNTHYFICVAHPVDGPKERRTLENGEWVGKVTLLGPLSKNSFELPEAGRGDAGPLAADEDETKWQMAALYVGPAHRGKELAKKLIAGAVNFADSERANKPPRIRVFLDPNKELVKKLYDSLGFVNAGMCTLKEAFLHNGDSFLLPADGGESKPEKWNSRVGLIMEKVKIDK